MFIIHTRRLFYCVESWLNETPSTSVEMLFLCPSKFGVLVLIKSLSNLIVGEGGNLLYSQDGGILRWFRFISQKRDAYGDLLGLSGFDQIVVNLTTAEDDFLNLFRSIDFVGSLFEVNSSESVSLLELIQVGSSLHKT